MQKIASTLTTIVFITLLPIAAIAHTALSNAERSTAVTTTLILMAMSNILALLATATKNMLKKSVILPSILVTLAFVTAILASLTIENALIAAHTFLSILLPTTITLIFTTGIYIYAVMRTLMLMDDNILSGNHAKKPLPAALYALFASCMFYCVILVLSFVL